MVQRIFRLVFVLLFITASLALAYYFLPSEIGQVQVSSPGIRYTLIGILGLIGGLLGILLAPTITFRIIRLVSWMEQRLQRMPAADITGGAVGLIIGLIIAYLLPFSLILRGRLAWVGGVFQFIASLLLGYLGLSVGMKKKDELLFFLPSFREKSRAKTLGQVKILDTSVIIDGRIADICKSGFVEGTLLIPGFVLEELRHIADSPDLLRRNRGRRGLDILNKMRKELDIKVQIWDGDFEEIGEVDSKLIKLARQLDAKIITNDFNLNKVAELQGVQVLNINLLANAVKPVVLPGEEMQVHIIKEGKESGQGVGYLDDGTMVVVEDGRRAIGQAVAVQVTSVLQTSAGRMIFARINRGDDHRNKGQDFHEVNAIG